MPDIKKKKCRNCGALFAPRYRTTETCCSWECAKLMDAKKRERKPRPRIAAYSTKRARQMRSYSKARREFLSRAENQICFIGGCGKKATTIEHTKGRVGDLLLDEQYWRPCCLEHNLELERNPELSKKYQESKIHEGKKI